MLYGDIQHLSGYNWERMPSLTIFSTAPSKSEKNTKTEMQKTVTNNEEEISENWLNT